MMGALDGKAAVIIGAGRGIGRAVAKLFAQEGASVLLNDSGVDPRGEGRDAGVARAVAGEITAAGGTAVENHDDASTAEGAERIVPGAPDAFGRGGTLLYAA